MDVIWGNLMDLLKIARKKLKNKILGITCHNSKKTLQKKLLNLKQIILLLDHFLNLN